MPYTENAIARVIAGARKAGVNVGAVKVEPDGSITVLDEKLAPAVTPKQDAPVPCKWDLE